MFSVNIFNPYEIKMKQHKISYFLYQWTGNTYNNAFLCNYGLASLFSSWSYNYLLKNECHGAEFFSKIRIYKILKTCSNN